MLTIVVTKEVSKLCKFNSGKEPQSVNILAISSINNVLKFISKFVKELQPANIEDICVTFEVSKFNKFKELKDLQL